MLVTLQASNPERGARALAVEAALAAAAPSQAGSIT